MPDCTRLSKSIWPKPSNVSQRSWRSAGRSSDRNPIGSRVSPSSAKSEQRVRDILDAAKDDPSSRIGTAYASFLDDAGVEAKGLTPIAPWLNQIRGLKSRAGYAALEGEAARNGVTGLFAGFVTQDDRNTDAYITALGQAGLGMPDRDMYLLSEPHMVELKAAYLDHLTKMLTLAGETNAAARG